MSSLIRVLINGRPAQERGLSPEDRGLQYGDGLFETMLLTTSGIRYLDDHMHRLAAGCERLGIPMPSYDTLSRELELASEQLASGVIKLIVTRGVAGRGYRPPKVVDPTRIILVYPAPQPEGSAEQGITVRWCQMRLSRNALLAGVKHLNRVEQVLAQREWDDPAVGEGLMLDTEGELVAGTMSNLFVVRNAVLYTPDLRYCGIRGVMRGRVLRAAAGLGIAVEEQPLWAADLATADEVFVTNAVRGVRAVGALELQRWPTGAVTRSLIAALAL